MVASRTGKLGRLIQVGLIVAAFGLLLLVTVFPIRADAGRGALPATAELAAP
jgi:hypothetical protein